MKDLFKDYKKITLGELNENTRHFIFDFLGQAMWEGFLYEYKGKSYKIADIERTSDKQLEIELVAEPEIEHTQKKRLADLCSEIPDIDGPRFLRKNKPMDTMDSIFNF